MLKKYTQKLFQKRAAKLKKKSRRRIRMRMAKRQWHSCSTQSTIHNNGLRIKKQKLKQNTL